ncbi:hypothetical protein CHS0354_003822 [Potamilus streckersoni]|uniref:Uncharacterized protein n=1 Tax=Potamilus streckersoni TaxID=2493646 RepID=A0AAE0VV48_9BIVA|nr:hypothetical protein CHS0354_003822 [Potamilus streckersoni]
MMHLLLTLMSLASMRCTQLQGSIITTEQRIRSQDSINQREHNLNLRSKFFPIHHWTAGNTLCRGNNYCDFHQSTKYTWCFTDYSDSWDYCCTGSCDFHQNSYVWCQTGTEWAYCGGNQTYDIQARHCLATFPCGLHQEVPGNDERHFWCYVDLRLNWDYCCAPWNTCDKHGYSYNWCYIMNSKLSDKWQECIPTL